MIGPAISRYVAYKQTLGCCYETQFHLLGQLDRFLSTRPISDLTAETFSAWCSSIERLMPSGRRMRMQIVRQFCLYRRRSEPTCFVPDPSQFPLRPPRPQPYIFSEIEIARLLLAADALRPYKFSPLHPKVARLALVLLYTSGLRRGEIVRLTLGDYDPHDRVLLVRDSKFHKSRMVPLSPDAVREIHRYLEDRHRLSLPREPDAPLLIHRRGGISAYSGDGLRALMRHLFRTAGVHTAAGRLPRVHDLRFTFAFHALLRWYHAGVDVQTRLPALATYMGHVSILSTQYYLPLLDVVVHQASERFDQHCARFLPIAPDERGDR
ncbi:MAG: tyrosine-type recombinase/integrase [Gemmatimonadaceae bacterium]